MRQNYRKEIKVAELYFNKCQEESYTDCNAIDPF
jgi:hypothetical protein